jgi:hypothetical protein
LDKTTDGMRNESTSQKHLLTDFKLSSCSLQAFSTNSRLKDILYIKANLVCVFVSMDKNWAVPGRFSQSLPIPMECFGG